LPKHRRIELVEETASDNDELMAIAEKSRDALFRRQRLCFPLVGLFVCEYDFTEKSCKAIFANLCVGTWNK